MRQFKLPTLCVAITAATVMITSCGDSKENGNLPTVNIDSKIKPLNQKVEAISGAEAGISGLASGVSAPVTNVTANMQSAATSLESMSILDNALTTTDTTEASTQSTSAIMAKVNKLKRSNPDQAMQELINGFFDIQSATADLSTNTITVGINSSEICTDDSLTTDDDENYQMCMDVLSNVTLTVQVINSDAGVVTLNYSGNTPLEFSYAPEYLALLVDLGELKESIVAFDAATNENVSQDLPDTFEGQFAISVNATQSNAKVKAWIPEAIKIGDSLNDITVAQTDNLMALELDSDDETMHFTSNINSISGQFNDDEDSFDVDFGGFEADILIDGINQIATITNTGTNANGLTVSMNGQTILSAMLAKFSSQYTESDQILSVSSAFSFVGNYLDKTIETITTTDTIETKTETELATTFTMPANTSLQSIVDGLKVTSGSATLSVSETETVCTRSWSGSNEASATQPSCMTDGPTDVTHTYNVGNTLFDENN